MIDKLNIQTKAPTDDKLVELAIIGVLVLGLGIGAYLILKPKRDEQ